MEHKRTIRQQIKDKLNYIDILCQGAFTSLSLDKIDEEVYDIIELTKIARKYISKGEKK